MREVLREEFQKRMTVMFNNEGISVDVDCATTNFDDMQKAGFVVFDQKELSLSASSKERSLRKLISRLKKNELTYEEAKDHYVEFGKMQSYFDGRIRESAIIRIELEKAFDEHFAEDKRFLGDLQKALEQRSTCERCTIVVYKEEHMTLAERYAKDMQFLWECKHHRRTEKT